MMQNGLGSNKHLLRLSYQRPEGGCMAVACILWLIPWTAVTAGLFNLLVLQERTIGAAVAFLPFALVEAYVIWVAIRGIFYQEVITLDSQWVQYRYGPFAMLRRKIRIQEISN